MLYFHLDNDELPETDLTDIACSEPYRIDSATAVARGHRALSFF